MDEETRLLVKKDSNDWQFIYRITGISIVIGALAFSFIYCFLK